LCFSPEPQGHGASSTATVYTPYTGRYDAVRSAGDDCEMRCEQCRCESLDARWSPLCPVCYELLHQEQRRAQTRPPEFDPTAWADPAALEARFDSALGSEL